MSITIEPLRCVLQREDVRSAAVHSPPEVGVGNGHEIVVGRAYQPFPLVWRDRPIQSLDVRPTVDIVDSLEISCRIGRYAADLLALFEYYFELVLPGFSC